MYISHEDLKQKIIAMERKYDKQFQIVFEAIKQLLEEDEKPQQKIDYVEAQKAYSGKKKKNNVFELKYAPPANPKKILRI